MTSVSPLEIKRNSPEQADNLYALYVQTAQQYNLLADDFNKLLHQVETLRKCIFGPRSEKLRGNHASQMIFDGIETDEEKSFNAQEKVTETITYERAKARKHNGRNPIPGHLPRHDIVCEPAHIGGKESAREGWKRIGEEITEEIDFRPGSFFVNRYIRTKYMRETESGGIEHCIGALPGRFQEKGMIGYGLAAHMVVSKYADHLPLHRQHVIYKRQGVEIPCTTMSDVIGRAAQIAEPVVIAMKKDLLSGDYIYSDDSPIPLLDTAEKRKCVRGYLWVYVSGDGRTTLFDYTRGRGQEGPRTFLEGFPGYLQTDGYDGYNGTVGSGKRLGCMMHNRRYYLEAQKEYPEHAAWMLARIGALYGIEREARERSLSPAEVYARRQEKSIPILNEMASWIEEQKKTVLPKSLLGEALTYSTNQWASLVRYTEDGRFSIDNGISERVIRALAIGRKNWMFAGSENGARWAAMWYSIIGSCRLTGINPLEYVESVLRIITTAPDTPIDSLIPKNWVKSP